MNDDHACVGPRGRGFISLLLGASPFCPLFNKRDHPIFHRGYCEKSCIASASQPSYFACESERFRFYVGRSHRHLPMLHFLLALRWELGAGRPANQLVQNNSKRPSNERVLRCLCLSFQRSVHFQFRTHLRISVERNQHVLWWN